MHQSKSDYQRIWKAKNPEYHKLWKRRWRQENPEKRRELARKYATNSRKWEKENPDRARANRLASNKRNRAKRNADFARYRAMKLRASPQWANRFFIDEIYRLAALRTKLLGVKYDVDHIVPLRGKIVCGLHWERNLKIITASENRRKHNRSWPDMPVG